MNQTRRSSVAGGLMLLGIGVLLVTGWWWPGIMLVIGVAGAAERVLERRYTAAGIIAVIFIGVPLLISAADHINIPGTWVAGLLVAGLGVTVLIRALTRRDDHRAQPHRE